MIAAVITIEDDIAFLERVPIHRRLGAGALAHTRSLFGDPTKEHQEILNKARALCPRAFVADRERGNAGEKFPNSKRVAIDRLRQDARENADPFDANRIDRPQIAISAIGCQWTERLCARLVLRIGLFTS